MVYISKIELRNFKSFEGRAEVNLVKGFNAITGKNGSGKSNIVDAIRFAFGENSVKALRESRMSALINDRGKGRAARVSVYLTNEGDAPFKEPQLVITRELFENGDQRYYINGKRTSKNNITDLLYSMGISSDGLNIVPQGAIGRIAEMNPSDRRELLEELIGLNVYDEKREEAMNRLREADALLSATFAKLDEKRETMIMLEEEMNELLRYETLQRDLARIRKTRLLAEAERLEKEAAEAQNLANAAEEELKKASEELEELTRAEAEPGYQAELIGRYASVKAEAEALKSELEERERERDELEGELKKLEDALRSMRSMEEGLVEELKRAREEEEMARAKLEEIKREEEGLAKEARQLREGLARARAEEAERRSRAMRLAKALLRLREARERAESDLLSIKPAVDSAREASEEYDSLIKINEEAAKRLREIISGGTSALRDESGRLQALLKEYEGVKKKREREREGIIRALAVLNRALGYVQAYREAGLDNQLGLDALFSSGVWKGYLGRLRDLIKAEEGYEGQVAAAVNWLGNPFVLEKRPDEGGLGSMNGLPRLRIAWLHEKPEDPCRCSVYWHVKVMDSRADPVIKALLSRICVEDCECCDAVVKKDLVVLGKGLAEAGVIRGQLPGIRGLIRTVERLEDELAKRSTELEEASRRARELKLELERRRARTAGLSAALRPIVELVSSEEAIVESIKKKVKDATKRLEQGAERARRAEAVLESIIRKEAELEEEMLNLLSSSGSADAEDAVRAVEERLERTRRARAEAEERATAAARKAYELEGKLEALKGSIDDVSKRAEEARESLGVVEKRLSELTKRAEEIGPELKALEERVSTVKAIGDAGLRDKKEELMKRIRELERRAERQRMTAAAKAEESSRLREEAMKIDVEPLELNKGVEPIEQALEAELSEISQKVNRMAYKDYRLYYESYRDASTRRSELERDREAILKFIDEIDREKTETFMKAFERIDRAFRETFSRLVDGKAWLELENPKNPFQGGIFMLAKFGEKKEREASSLSGGEKAIASVAFLLALQAAYRSHFYIFDEIDANLDAERSKRLGEFLHEWGKENQVILVSLKDTLISNADRVIGVYERDGASRVIEMGAEEIERG